LKPIVGRIRTIGTDVLAFLPLLGIALVVFVALWLIGRLLTRSGGLFGRIAPNTLVQTLFGQVIRLTFILVGVILAMRIMGASALLGSVLGAAGVFGLAVGFAIRDTIENYIASILLSIRRPFAPNDLVVIEGYEGRVTRLNSRATFLTTLAGNEVRIPNAIVYKAKIENFTTLPERRFEFTVGIGYDDDLCTALAVAHRATCSASGVLANPDPTVVVDTLGASTVVLLVQAWVNQERSDFGKARSAAMRAVKEAFEDNGISMPEPITNIRMMDTSASQTPSRKPRVDPEEEGVTDTAADRTIEAKVASMRSEGEKDLLSAAAPRE
jgi:small-conductance mechanosensitive channel